MPEEKDQTTIQLGDIKPLLKSGVTCRTFTALSLTDKPYLTLEEIGEICGLSPASLVHNGFLGDLFHAQLVERVSDEEDRRRAKGYRLTERAKRSGYNAADAEIEELREKARKQTRTTKRKIHRGMAVVGGGVGEAKE